MGQAFVIMQIGNSQLDKVYEDAIAPALRDNNLNPNRVDKHNKGGLLKSEITGFIKKSDIIIADLTNERPNCYLEVGYAMGQELYSNLILTAREDHNLDSPNHTADGPKVHFDLTGYDILWWNPSDIQNFKVELDKRIKRRLKTIYKKPKELKLPFDEKWIASNQKEAYSAFQDYGKVSYMEVKMALQDSTLNVEQNDLLNIAEKIERPHTGWPVALVFFSQRL